MTFKTQAEELKHIAETDELLLVYRELLRLFSECENIEFRNILLNSAIPMRRRLADRLLDEGRTTAELPKIYVGAE